MVSRWRVDLRPWRLVNSAHIMGRLNTFFLRSRSTLAMLRIAILGATGYTALELIKSLVRHQ